MSRLAKSLTWLAIDPSKPELAAAQFRELQRQAPFLYFLLIFNSIAVAYTHYTNRPNH